MAEYIEKQAAVKAVGFYSLHSGDKLLFADEALKAIPPADVRPVVLCGDCRWFNDRGYPNLDPEMPELRMGHCSILGRDVQACWFCASGEGKGGDAE